MISSLLLVALLVTVGWCTDEGPLMAIGGSIGTLSSAEVLNTSCDFPLPEGRRDHISVTTADGKTLVCGGMTPSGYTASCLQFDYKSKSWKEHSELLSKYRHYSAVVILPRGVYVLGGRDDAKSSSDFLAAGSSFWTQGPDIPALGVFKSCAVKLSDTEFVILGGQYDNTLALVYSETTKAWTYWPKLTQAVFGHCCARLGDNILMAGGWITQRTVIIDTKTGSAREVASLKYPRTFADMEVYEGKAVILGGYDGTGTRRSDSEMWNTDTETWEEADISLKNGRSSYSLVVMAEEIYCEPEYQPKEHVDYDGLEDEINSGVVTSPRFPYNYGNFEEITTTIKLAPGKTIHIQFIYFDLENNYDFLTIEDGNGLVLLNNATGPSLPSDIDSDTNKVIILFSTDRSVTKRGFQLMWTEE